jgi:glycosyltransferase involved in cell wall biosynthesis
MLWPSNPGVQVIISTHNVDKYISECLQSVEYALKGFKWVLILSDDSSSDKTYDILKSYKSLTADQIILERFGKAINVAAAKNRAIGLGKHLRDEYPAIVLMDADDLMGEDRVSHLLPFAVENGHLAVVGDHQRMGFDFPIDHYKIYRVRDNAHFLGFYGPWATLFHASLIPEDGKLFREDIYLTGEDGLLWQEWLAKGVKIVPHTGKIVHYYQRRRGSVFSPEQKEEFEKMEKRYRDISFEIFYGRQVNLDLPINTTFYCVIQQESQVEEALKTLQHNMSHLCFFPNIQFAVVDMTPKYTLNSLVKYPLVKEIACGMLKYIRAHDLSEDEVNRKILETTTGEKLCFHLFDHRLSSFLISRVLDVKDLNFASINSTLTMKREFFLSTLK